MMMSITLVQMSITLVQRFSDMRREGRHWMEDGAIAVEFVVPCARKTCGRNTWEFRINGVVTARRYSPKTAAAYFVELINA